MTDDSHVPTRLEADARAIVPVQDEIGGTVIYVHGRPAYYVLHGEWFPAVSQPTARGVEVDDGALDAPRVDGASREEPDDSDRHGAAVSTS